MTDDNLKDVIESYINKLKQNTDFPLFQGHFYGMTERQEVPIPPPTLTAEAEKYFRLYITNPVDAETYYNSLPIEKRLEINNIIGGLEKVKTAATEREEKQMHLNAIRELTPKLKELDNEIKKIRDTVKDFETKMNDFIKHKTELQKLGVTSSEISKEVPGTSLFLNITPAQLRRFTAETGKLIPRTPEQISEDIVISTPENGIIDPLTGKIYRYYTDYANSKGIRFGSGSAHVFVVKEQCDLLPNTEENRKLVKDCITDPNCIKYLEEQEKLVRETAKLSGLPEWFWECSADRVKKILLDYEMEKKLKQIQTLESSK